MDHAETFRRPTKTAGAALSFATILILSGGALTKIHLGRHLPQIASRIPQFCGFGGLC
jgi:hypothetical protein